MNKVYKNHLIRQNNPSLSGSPKPLEVCRLFKGTVVEVIGFSYSEQNAVELVNKNIEAQRYVKQIS